MEAYKKDFFLSQVEESQRADVELYLDTVYGMDIPSMPGFSWSYDETYKTQESRDKMRAAILLPAPAKAIEVVSTLATLTDADMEREEKYMDSEDGL